MPWTIADVEKHNKGLTLSQKKKWVTTSNLALAACIKKEGKDCAAQAIRIANGVVKTNKEEPMEDNDILNNKRKIDRTYRSWDNMIQRCTNTNAPDYPDYGAKGITVPKQWRDSYDAFLEDMGARPEGTSLDRKNGKGNYSKANCRWASPKQQAQNRSTSVNEEKETQIREDNMLRINEAQPQDYETRYETYKGSKYLVVPIIMMAEGVHNGSHGKVYHSAEALEKYPAAWNGIPIVIYHPEEDGINVSANRPDIIEQVQVGRVFGTHFENNQLRAEAWLNEKRLKKISPESYTMIQNKDQLEISVGVFTDDEEVNGEWQGEVYTAMSKNHRPDHLALLPGLKGACSWEDGCGVRVNQEGGGIVRDIASHIQSLCELHNYETGKKQLLEVIHQKLNASRSAMVQPATISAPYYWVDELFDDYFIYKDEAKPEQFLQQDYKLDKNGNLVLVGDPKLVTEDVSYKLVNTNKNKGGPQTMTEKNAKGCCPEKVELLIQSESFSFDEDNREWLDTLEEAQIDKLLEAESVFDENTNLKGQITDLTERLTAMESKVKRTKPVAPLQMNKEQALKVLKEHLEDPDRFLALLPADSRRQMEHGLRLHQAYRSDLVSKIKENAPEDVYSDQELLSMEDADLEKISKLVRPKVDYSAMRINSGMAAYDSPVEPLLPPGASMPK